MREKDQFNVLMVCLGNICRSPLAEGILKDLVVKQNLPWSVDSAGTAGYHVGELPDSRSIEVAKNNGVDLRDQRSRKLVKADILRFDKILAMDTSNYNDILSLCETEADRSKVELLLNYSQPGMNPIVPDPYYEGGFHLVFNLIKKGCIDFIEAQLKD